LVGAAIGLLTTVASDSELRDLTFWQLGSVGGASWPVLGASVPFVAVAVIGMPRLARRLDLLALGEREAEHLGVRVTATRRTVIVLAPVATGAAVAVSGILSFVGLLVPHLIRLVRGPGHRGLLPASALGAPPC
jgi:ABC-type Fe3+-siderophore transport system, permease component